MAEKKVEVKPYRQTIYLFVTMIAKWIPKPVKKILRDLKIVYLWRWIYSKYESELSFQKKWAVIFKDNVEKVHEYYKKYRHLDVVKEICGFNKDKVVLDIGCGISSILHYLEGKKYGLDPLAEEYKKIYNYPDDIVLVAGFGEKIEFEDGYFDIVFSNNNLDHVTDPQKVVNEVHRVLKSDGHFVLNVDISESSFVDLDVGHPHGFTRDDIYSLIKGKYEIIDERETGIPGIMNYVNGKLDLKAVALDLIMVKI